MAVFAVVPSPSTSLGAGYVEGPSLDNNDRCCRGKYPGSQFAVTDQTCHPERSEGSFLLLPHIDPSLRSG